MMGAEVRLAAGPAEVAVWPGTGALVGRFTVADVDVLHPAGGVWPGGSFPLLPWSNRISGGGFTFGGRFHALEPNLPGEPFPIHGNAWQSAWVVAGRQSAAGGGERSSSRLLLTLESNGPGPFAYEARLLMRLTADREGVTLASTLSVVNRATEPLPYGLGFHPSFVRRPGMRLSAPADAVWLEDERHLPTRRVPVSQRPAWDFSQPTPFPAGWINNAFEGWVGRAVIDDPQLRRRIVVTARNLSILILYSPDASAPFLCLEPVSHAVDAHNAPHLPGLTVLRRGDHSSAAMRIRVLTTAP